MEKLTSEERKTLRSLEDVIEKVLHTFLEVGKALIKIRDERLYRAEHRTFEDYCKVRWSMTLRHAERMMIAYKVADEMRPTGRVPTKESQVRHLRRLKRAKDRKEAWKRAIEAAPKGEPTAKEVEEAVEEVSKEVPAKYVTGKRTANAMGVMSKKAIKEEWVEESFDFSEDLTTQIIKSVTKMVEEYGERIICIMLQTKIGSDGSINTGKAE